MAHISKYQVIWVEFFPSYGIVTKHDRRQFGDRLCMGRGEKTHRKHFASREEAISYLKNFGKNLDKNYTCRLFTDAQFGLAKQETGYAIPYTTKQWEEVYHIGPVAITTLSDLADYINASEDWPLDVADIIKANGWVNDTHLDCGICHNAHDTLEFNEDGIAVVK